MTKHETTDVIAADNDQFSDLGESIDTDTTSLTSTILQHVYDNGRRYHSLNAGKYSMPNDKTEQERLDIFRHAISLLMGGELHFVKLPEKLDRVLDCGTGTGIWAIDFADTHPESHVTGVDLSPIQPCWVPPNCQFEVDDLEKPWIWPHTFDFIHSSNIAQGIRDFPVYTQRIFDNLTPGGVVQLHESQMSMETDDDSIPRGGYLERYYRDGTKALKLAGLEDKTDQLAGYLKDAGFVGVKVVQRKLPIGPWAKDKKMKELGRWGLAVFEQGLKSYAVGLYTRFLGLAHEEVIELCDGALKELGRRDVHVYSKQWFVEGRRPAEEETRV